MRGVIERFTAANMVSDAGPFIDLRTEVADTIRKVVEGRTSLALDAKADREALIRDLIEALC